MIELLFLVLLPLIGSVVPVLTKSWSRSYSALATAILPAAALAVVLQLAPAIFPVKPYSTKCRGSKPWGCH